MKKNFSWQKTIFPKDFLSTRTKNFKKPDENFLPKMSDECPLKTRTNYQKIFSS